MTTRLSRRRWRAASLACALAAAFTVSACGESDTPAEGAQSADTTSSVDAGATDTTAAGLGLSTKRNGATTGPRVAMDAELQDDGTVSVRVLVRDIPDLYAIAAHLTWDAKVLELVEHSGHLMMVTPGYLSKTLVKPAGTHRVLLGAARYANGGSPWSGLEGAKVANELWATLRFKALGDGVTTLTFDPDHSVGKSADYKDLDLTWQQLEITATGGAR